ncbi:MAG: NADH-quinone oxidoreductase subunit NuoE [Candidatus Omnitrophica bacterium]|nr:NADH-quinone oxidoreductase subunit NuoE [Candidatus Omnitrophota bacterium]MDD5574863.1 NADH-quinone oxidoreductase subunit NuoE [Candidatus Omnitrophota bacterium]
MISVQDDKVNQLKQFMEKAKAGTHPESQLIAILHRAQEIYGHLDQAVMDEIALTMNIPTAHIWGVATFYHYFNLKPKGKHTISVCLGTACYVKGAAQILETIKKELKVEIGETTGDGIFTLVETRCLGTCGLAPVMMIDDKVYGTLTPKKTVEILQGFYKK